MSYVGNQPGDILVPAAGIIKSTGSALATASDGTDYVSPSNLTGTARTFTAQQTPMNGTLTDGATIDWNGNTNGQVVKVTLGGNRSLNAPTNITENNLYVLRVIQDGTGSRTLGFNAAYKFAGGVVPTLTTTASAVDIFTFLGGSGNVLYCTGKTLDAK